MVLVLVETTDVMFALDSIPAIFGVTKDPFLVYTSNVFAILGLAFDVLRAGGRHWKISLTQVRAVRRTCHLSGSRCCSLRCTRFPSAGHWAWSRFVLVSERPAFARDQAEARAGGD